MDVSQLHDPPIPDLVIQCIKSLVINGDGITSDHFDDDIIRVRHEVSDNLNLPIEKYKLVTYISEIIDFYSLFEERIQLGKDNILTSSFTKFKNIEPEALGKMDSDFYQSFLNGLKTRFRSELSFYIQISKEVKSLIENGQEEKKKITTNILLEYDNTNSNYIISSSDIRIKSFRWISTKTFYEDMVKLHFHLTLERIISNEITPAILGHAFNGKIINQPLKIKWIVRGKNKLTSKSSLFYFLDELIERKLIEKLDCRVNNKPMYEKILMIFVDANGKSFNNLEVSRTESVKASPIKSEVICKIIKEMISKS